MEKAIYKWLVLIGKFYKIFFKNNWMLKRNNSNHLILLKMEKSKYWGFKFPSENINREIHFMQEASFEEAKQEIRKRFKFVRLPSGTKVYKAFH